MNFKEHFKNLLIPLKESSKNFVSIFTAIAEVFECLKEYAVSITARTFSQNIEQVFHKYIENIPEGLTEYEYKSIKRKLEDMMETEFNLFAKERGIIKIYRENDQSYHNRIVNAFAFSKKSSTLKGMEDILLKVTDKKFTLRELYKEDWILGVDLLEDETILGGDVSAYIFVVDFQQTFLTLSEEAYLNEIIDLYKPAHVSFHLNARIIDDWFLGMDNELLGISTYL